MRIGIISDIHGNFPALVSVWNALQSDVCDEYLCLGDIVGYYPMINECIGLLRDNGVLSLMGNHDAYMTGKLQCTRSRSVNACIAYQQTIIHPENLAWLASLSSYRHVPMYYAMHGSLNDPLDGYIKNFDFAEVHSTVPGCKRFFSGHTHIQTIQHKDTLTYCNPGSVGQPRDHNPWAAYAIFDTHAGITLKRVPYDIDKIAFEMKNAGFDAYYYANLYKGLRIGANQ